MGGGAAITWALPDVMLKQWRAVWTALGGLWVAISAGRRAPAGRTSNCCTLPRGTYMTRMPWHRGSLVGPSVEVLMSNNGRQYREMRGRATKIPTSRSGTFCIISKREAVGMDRRRCGLIEHDGGRDAKAVACRMDHAKRLQVAISVARSDVWQASAGARPS